MKKTLIICGGVLLVGTCVFLYMKKNQPASVATGSSTPAPSSNSQPLSVSPNSPTQNPQSTDPNAAKDLLAYQQALKNGTVPGYIIGVGCPAGEVC